MNLADSELLMLENLTCINKDTMALVKGLKPVSSYRTVGDYLSFFDETVLRVLEAKGNTTVAGGECSGSELAAMIRYMKENKVFQRLNIVGSPVNKNNHTMALCMEDPLQPQSAIVAFYGTLDSEEWKDNAEGLYQADTDAQREALLYIDSLPYKDLTVIGHSKGGNKAQYVTILSNKVRRGLSFDGQGFSREFIDKYSSAIAKNAGKIKNYSLSTDFIHPLLSPIPGATQLYVDGGSDVKSIGEHHSPNAFFVFYVDSNNHTQIVCTKEGIPYLPMTEEDPSVRVIHNFTNFIQHTANELDKKVIGDYVGDLLAIQFDSSLSYERRLNTLLKRLLRIPKESATLFAYLLKYIEAYHLKNKDVTPLLQALGLSELKQLLDFDSYDLKNILKALRQELSYWEKNMLLYHIVLLLLSVTELTFNVYAFWQELEDKFLSLKGNTLP